MLSSVWTDDAHQPSFTHDAQMLDYVTFARCFMFDVVLCSIGRHKVNTETDTARFIAVWNLVVWNLYVYRTRIHIYIMIRILSNFTFYCTAWLQSIVIVANCMLGWALETCILPSSSLVGASMSVVAVSLYLPATAHVVSVFVQFMYSLDAMYGRQ